MAVLLRGVRVPSIHTSSLSYHQLGGLFSVHSHTALMVQKAFEIYCSWNVWSKYSHMHGAIYAA